LKKNQLSPGVILCLIIAAFWLAFSLHPKSKIQTAKAIETKTVVAAAVEPKVPTATNAAITKSLHVPVLMYHHVGITADAASFDLTVSPTDFETQVKYFKALGYESVSVQQVYAGLELGALLPKKPIVFTFDDGYKDVFENAIPILKKYGYSGSFAVATELLGRPGYAVWDDVIAADQIGMEILSHSENHLDLSNPIYADYDLEREISDSKKVLEQKLGRPVDFFVYPYGKYNPKTLELIKEAGYKMAFTTAYGQDLSASSLLTEPRVRVHGGSDGLEKLKKVIWK